MHHPARSRWQSLLDPLIRLGRFLAFSLNPRLTTYPELTNNNNAKIAYLSGIRGIAALLVYFQHHTAYSHRGGNEYHRSFGFNGHYHIICIPGLRLLFSGGGLAVALFFTISGYVLSLRPLNLLQKNEGLALAQHLGSALPRRWVRLYYPVLGTTFTFITLWHLLGTRSNKATSAAPEETYLLELWKWLRNFNDQSFVFAKDPFKRDQYNGQLWAIPMEFRGCIMVYGLALVMFAFNHYGTVVRLAVEAALAFYFLYVINAWYIAVFIAGMLLCDFDLLSESNQVPRIFSSLKRLALRGWTHYILFAIGLYFGGVPQIHDIGDLRDTNPGWYYLSWLVPKAAETFPWFFCAWSAILVMISIPRISWVRAFFETGVCQYLGRISFGLYLVHGPILWTIGDRVYAAVGRPRETAEELIPGWINAWQLPDVGPLGLEVNTIAAHLILLPLSLWLAVVATKLFDEPSVLLGRYLFSRSHVKGSGTSGEQITPSWARRRQHRQHSV